MTVAEKIADFVLETEYDSIPTNIKELAKRSLVDYVGVTFIGASTRESEILMDYIGTHAQKDECSIIGRSGYYSIEDAALVNGYFAHILDYDDAGMVGHPSAVLMSTCFTTGEVAAISGTELMTAYIIGYEVSLKLADALMPELTGRGWHGTPVFGCIGAASVAGRILKLSKEQLVNAIGIAATMASGLMENFGTTTKPFHAGMAASNGIKAVKLAQAGLIASPTALEGTCGYGNLFAQIQLTPEDLTLGTDWRLYDEDLLLKKYPCCSAAHASLNALEDIRDEEGIVWEDIDKIDVGVTKFTLINLIHPNPQSPIEARFSMQYAIATTLVIGKFNVKCFKGEILRDERVRSMIQRIRMYEAEEFADDPYADNEPGIVDIYMKDGRHFRKRVDFARGTTINPISDDELYEKFYDCVGGKNGKTEKQLKNLLQIERIPDIRFFMGTIM